MYMIGTNNADGTPNFCIITWLGFSADSVPCLMMTIQHSAGRPFFRQHDH